MPVRSPEPTRCYYDHHLDSRRWTEVPLRKDDIIIATPAKAGTTWTQRIVSVLVLGEKLPQPLMELSIWVDSRFFPVPFADLKAALAAQPHRRFHKAHIPFDALPYEPSVKYICVGRDGRDAAVSLFNHYSGYSDHMHGWLNGPPGTFPDTYPRAPSDIRAFLRDFFSRGNPRFPWESDGYPYWSQFRLVQSFWDYRDLPNVLLVHYSDLKRDLGGEAARIARFLDIEPAPALIKSVESYCSFEAMKSQGDDMLGLAAQAFDGGAQTFFHKGVSGRWRELFTPEELKLYDAAVQRNLTPDCGRWLEEGRLASGIDPALI